MKTIPLIVQLAKDFLVKLTGLIRKDIHMEECQ